VQHPLIQTDNFKLVEEYVTHLIHLKAYEHAAEVAGSSVVLDWGCNLGYGMQILKSRGAKIAGLDVVPDAIAAARAALPADEDNIRLYDGATLPFEPGTFDVVTSFQVLEHIADYEAYFKGIRQALKPGGIAIFTTPNRRLRLEEGMKPWNEFHVREFSADELYRLLSQWFRQVEIRALRGGKKIEAVERARCSRLKQWAAGKQVTQGTYERVRGGLRRRIWGAAEAGSDAFSARTAARYSLSQLYYSETDLDNGLDLMATVRTQL